MAGMTRRFRTAAFHLALGAILLRALLPAGWMPSAESGAPLTICTLNGPVQLAPDQPGPAKAAHRDACPFWTASSLGQTAAAPALAPPSPAAPTLFQSTRPPLAAPIARHAPQAPRAPPAFA